MEGGGKHHTTLPIFPENCMKMKIFWPGVQSLKKPVLYSLLKYFMLLNYFKSCKLEDENSDNMLSKAKTITDTIRFCSAVCGNNFTYDSGCYDTGSPPFVMIFTFPDLNRCEESY